MGDLTLVCASCGKGFVWTEKEQHQARSPRPTDTEDEATGDLVDVEIYCKPCRPKQDQQRG